MGTEVDFYAPYLGFRVSVTSQAGALSVGVIHAASYGADSYRRKWSLQVHADRRLQPPVPVSPDVSDVQRHLAEVAGSRSSRNWHKFRGLTPVLAPMRRRLTEVQECRQELQPCKHNDSPTAGTCCGVTCGMHHAADA